MMRSLRLKRDFDEVFSAGRWLTTRDSPVKVRVIPKGLHFQIGLILSRKTGNAVNRNKAKRQVRVILRDIYNRRKIYGKFAIIFTRQFVEYTFQEKCDRLNRILQKSSIK